MSPILVRPVREQLEHDRIIRLLQAKYRRKHEVGVNSGAEQNAPAGPSTGTVYPDLVLYAPERGRRVQGIVEVETGESVNHLEALAEWAVFSRLRVPFHLYVPSAMVDVARRLAEDNQIYVTELWTYHTVGDQPRFTLVHRNKELPATAAPRAARPAPVRPAPARPAGAAKKAASRTAKAPARKAPARKAARPVRTARAAKRR